MHDISNWKKVSRIQGRERKGEQAQIHRSIGSVSVNIIFLSAMHFEMQWPSWLADMQCYTFLYKMGYSSKIHVIIADSPTVQGLLHCSCFPHSWMAILFSSTSLQQQQLSSAIRCTAAATSAPLCMGAASGKHNRAPPASYLLSLCRNRPIGTFLGGTEFEFFVWERTEHSLSQCSSSPEHKYDPETRDFHRVTFINLSTFQLNLNIIT